MEITHKFSSPADASANPDIVDSTKWNDTHDFLGPFVNGVYLGTFTTGGALVDTSQNYLAFTRTGTGTYSADLLSDAYYWSIIAQAWDGSEVHHDVASTVSFDGGGAHVEIRVRTRAGTLVDLTSGTLQVVAVAHGQ
jgi:hypothetical protein